MSNLQNILTGESTRDQAAMTRSPSCCGIVKLVVPCLSNLPNLNQNGTEHCPRRDSFYRKTSFASFDNEFNTVYRPQVSSVRDTTRHNLSGDLDIKTCLSFSESEHQTTCYRRELDGRAVPILLTVVPHHAQADYKCLYSTAVSVGRYRCVERTVRDIWPYCHSSNVRVNANPLPVCLRGSQDASFIFMQT